MAKKKGMTPLDWTALILLTIGGINWGLGLFNFNLVELIFKQSLFTTIVYALVGVSALYAIYDYATGQLPKMKALDNIAFWLLVVGGLNWGLVTLNVNLVELIFGSLPMVANIVYGLVGIAGVYSLYFLYQQTR